MLPRKRFRMRPTATTRSFRYERIRQICPVYPGLYLSIRLADAAGRAERGRRGHLRDGRQRAPDSLHRLRQDRGGVFPDPDPAGRKSFLQRRSTLHRTIEGAHQRPVRQAERAVRGRGDPGYPLARGCPAVAEAEADEEARRDPADHAGVTGIADDQPPHGDSVTVRRSALHRHR